MSATQNGKWPLRRKLENYLLMLFIWAFSPLLPNLLGLPILLFFCIITDEKSRKDRRVEDQPSSWTL